MRLKYMGFFSQYLAYLRDNPQGYWFKRKLYGWGWTPATWQGSAITIGYVVIVLALALVINQHSSWQEVVFGRVIPVLLVTALFIVLIFKNGEPPHWTWGRPRK